MGMSQACCTIESGSPNNNRRGLCSDVIHASMLSFGCSATSSHNTHPISTNVAVSITFSAGYHGGCYGPTELRSETIPTVAVRLNYSD
jgi:hypothetical protein